MVYFYISVIMVIDDANAFVIAVECDCLFFLYVSCRHSKKIYWFSVAKDTCVFSCSLKYLEYGFVHYIHLRKSLSVVF